METNKILETLIANPDIGARRLAALSGAKLNTVETVLQRHQNAIEAVSSKGEGRPGRPGHLYRVRPQWVAPLQARWTSEARDGLEQALRVLEAASFAAVDPVESPEERVRMAEMTRLRAGAARALLVTAATDEVRREAEGRIQHAESRLAPPVHEPAQAPEPAQASAGESLQPADALLGWRRFWARADGFGADVALVGLGGAGTQVMDLIAPEVSQGGPVPDALRPWWARWVRQVSELAVQVGGAYSGPVDAEDRGLALVLDCVPRGGDAMPAHLMEALDALRKPTLNLRVADLGDAERRTFMRGFRNLALDPIARHANLFVTVDSRNDASRAVWLDIEKLAERDHADLAVMVAQTALRDTVAHAAKVGWLVAPATLYCTDFVTQVLETKQQHKGLWSLYGAPQVLDAWADTTFGAACEISDWTYHGRPGTREIRGIAMGQTERSYTAPMKFRA